MCQHGEFLSTIHASCRLAYYQVSFSSHKIQFDTLFCLYYLIFIKYHKILFYVFIHLFVCIQCDIVVENCGLDCHTNFKQ